MLQKMFFFVCVCVCVCECVCVGVRERETVIIFCSFLFLSKRKSNKKLLRDWNIFRIIFRMFFYYMLFTTEDQNRIHIYIYLDIYIYIDIYIGKTKSKNYAILVFGWWKAQGTRKKREKNVREKAQG